VSQAAISSSLSTPHMTIIARVLSSSSARALVSFGERAACEPWVPSRRPTNRIASSRPPHDDRSFACTCHPAGEAQPPSRKRARRRAGRRRLSGSRLFGRSAGNSPSGGVGKCRLAAARCSTVRAIGRWCARLPEGLASILAAGRRQELRRVLAKPSCRWPRPSFPSLFCSAYANWRVDRSCPIRT
jgi:hypothetical protein